MLPAVLSAAIGADESACLAPGELDTVLDFKGKELVENNLGGIGYDSWAPPHLRFANVGTTGTFSSVGPNVSFDLVITNTTEYRFYNYQWTRVNGEFGEINLLGSDDWSITAEYGLKFCAVRSGESIDNLITLKKFPLTFYDL